MSATLQKPLRTMIVGDSMTQGSEGDYTWRYRLWHWIHEQGIDISFTGPYKGTQEHDEPSPPRPPPLYRHHDEPGPLRCHGGYAKDCLEDFDSLHFSTWGRQCAITRGAIQEMVEKYMPDLLLIMLGFNDIGWFVSDAKGTLESMHILVANARAANPHIQFALANIPQRTKMDGREDLPKSTIEYNELLQGAVKTWNSKESPICIVDVCKEYTAETSTFDGLHPNALGDYQIARAFSLTLHSAFKLGNAPLSVPSHIPPRSLHTPTNFQVLSSPVGVTAVWDHVYGALGYEFRHKINDGDFSVDTLLSNRWDSHWAAEGDVHTAQVRALYGNEEPTAWTDLQTSTAHPELAPGPDNIKIKDAPNGVHITWDAPKGAHTEHILQYSVLYIDNTEPGMFPGLSAFKHSPADIDEFKSGHTYDVGMITWNTAGEGRLGPMQKHTVGKK